MTARDDFFRKLDGSQSIYTTLEFYNSGFGVKRYITGQQADKALRLEADAPRNPDTVVTFTAAPFEAPEPIVGEQGDVALNARIYGAGLFIEEALRERVEEESIEMIWRQYLGNETYPVFVLVFEVNDVTTEEIMSIIKGETINTSGLDVSERYTTDRFPGLRRSI